jgi:hypothetical protein
MSLKASITLTDPVSNKEARLDDPMAVRQLLAGVVERLSDGEQWKGRIPKDSTERVAVQIIRAAGGIEKALDRIKLSETLESVLVGTDLAEDVKKGSKKGDRPTAQVPLAIGTELRHVASDVEATIGDLWETFRARVEATGGEKSQTIVARVVWHPPTPNREGYIGVSANLSISTRKRTRTGVVSKKRGGAVQFALFGERGEDE